MQISPADRRQGDSNDSLPHTGVRAGYLFDPCVIYPAKHIGSHFLHGDPLTYRTTSTAPFAFCTTRVEMLPSRNRSMAPRPLAPTTMRSAWCFSAPVRIRSLGLPDRHNGSAVNPASTSFCILCSSNFRPVSFTLLLRYSTHGIVDPIVMGANGRGAMTWIRIT